MGICFGVASKQKIAAALAQDNVAIVDARPQNKYEKKHIDGALNLPVGGPMASAAAVDKLVDGMLSNLPVDKSTPIVCYCEVGGEAACAVKGLQRKGYTAVVNGGGYGAVAKIHAVK